MTPDVIDKILGESNQPTITIPVSMKLNIVGIITMFAGLGLIGMSYFIGLHDEESRLGLLATGTLVILISIGVLFASLRVKKHIENIEDRALTDTAL